MSLDMFLGDSNANAILPHAVYVGSTTGGFVAHTISAVNDDSLRVLVGEQDVAEQLGAFKLGLANNNTGDLRSTGVLDSYGYETNIIGKSLQFKTDISGVAAQKIDTIVGLSGGVVENEGPIGIVEYESEDDNDADLAVPEPTVVRGGFVVDANGSVIGHTKSKPSSARRPSRPAPPRPSETPLTQQKRGRGLTLGQLMDSPSSSSSRGRVTRTRADASWINDAKKDDDDDVDNLSLNRKQRERAQRRGRGRNKKYDD